MKKIFDSFSFPFPFFHDFSHSGNIFAQSTRSLVNNGVDLYDKGKFVDSEVEFKKGLEKSPDNFQANFNLGDSYYKEGKYEDALKNYSAALSKAMTDNQKAAVITISAMRFSRSTDQRKHRRL